MNYLKNQSNKHDDDMAHEIVTTTTGQVVEIDTDTKKCRKILHDLADLTI